MASKRELPTGILPLASFCFLENLGEVRLGSEVAHAQDSIRQTN